MAELDELEALSRRIDTLKTPFKGSTVPSLILSATEVGGQFIIQNKNAFVSESEYRRGEPPGFRDHFTPLYHPLPKTDTPTRVSVIIIEDGMTDSPAFTPVHGLAAAASSSAAWQALTGDAHLPGIAFNRMPYADVIGPERKPLLGPFLPDRHKRDLAMPVMKAWMQASSYQVMSTSTSHFSESLEDRNIRKQNDDRLDDFFGKNVVYIRSAGNDQYGSAQLRHSAYSFHPSSLLVGACQSLPVSCNEGAHKTEFRAQHLESYSNYSPDIVWETNPTDATYNTSLQAGVTTYEVMDGTSFAAPQVAAVVAGLLRRYGKSRENPEAVLAKEDILLALRQTAQPIHSREYGSSHSTAVTSRAPLQLFYVGKQYVSEEAGCGSIDLPALYQHLDAMEQAIKDGKATSLARETIDRVIPTPVVPADAKGHYYYPVMMDSPNITDTIVIDVKSRGLISNYPNSTNTLYLSNPDGQLLQLMPSMHSDKQYLIAKSSSFHGVAIKGEWQLVATEPLESAHISFTNSMHPDHVNVTVQPDEPTRFRNLYKNADLRKVHELDLDARMMVRNDAGVPMIAQHDFSTAIFPEGFIELQIARLAACEQDRPHAIALVNSGYAPLKPHKQAYHDAIAKGDVAAIIAISHPDEKAKSDLIEHIIYDYKKPEIVRMLMDNGFAQQKNHIGTPFIVRLTQVADRGGDWEWDENIAMLDAGIASLQEQNITLLQTDNSGKTLRDYSNDPDVRETVDKAIMQEGLRSLKELKVTAKNLYELLPKEVPESLPSLEQIGDKLKAIGLDFSASPAAAPAVEAPPTPVINAKSASK